MANLPDRVTASPSPSTAAIAISTAIISGVTGYYLGQAKSIGIFSKPRTSVDEDESSDLSDADADADDDDHGDDQHDASKSSELRAFAGSTEECKLVLVVRTDLGMTKGKIAAQCSHATLACYKTLLRADPAHPLIRRWERLGQAKVALKVDGEDDMLLLQAQAVSLGLCAQLIHDAGRTQIAAGSATVLGIGPAPKSQIDQVTGHLKLL